MLYETIRARIAQRGVHPELGDTGEGWWIEQNADELAAFLVWCDEAGCKSLLEVGAGHRHGLARLLVHDLGWQVVSLDRREPAYREAQAELLIADTADTDLCRLLLGQRRFDVVLLDADHSYDAVKRDWRTFAGHADICVAVHDIAGLRHCEGAAQFWGEVSGGPGWHSVVADGSRAAGLGWWDVRAEKVYIAPDFDTLSVADLRGMAERRGLALKARMTKAELVALLGGAS